MLFSKALNFKIAIAAKYVSFEEITNRIEQGLDVYKKTGNPSKLAASAFLFHVKLDATKQSMSIHQIFVALQTYTACMNPTQNNKKDETAN